MEDKELIIIGIDTQEEDLEEDILNIELEWLEECKGGVQ